MSPARRLRISGGRLRGLKIEVPAGIRPTSGRLREALFDIWGGRIEGASFLDLFAGSGAVGIEAASRGAGRVLMIEGDRGVFAILQRNRRLAGLDSLAERCVALPGELRRRLPAQERFDLIFADPPYGHTEHEALLAAAEPYLAASGEIALEHRWHGEAAAAVDGLSAIRSRRYGESGLTLYRRPSAQS